MPTEVFVGDRPELGVGTGSNALAGPAVGRLGGAHKLTRRFDICKASADKSSRAATLAATDCSACANQSPASCLTRGCVTGITRCCMHGDVARWLYWSRPGDRSGYGTTSVALKSTVKCSADRSAIGTHSQCRVEDVRSDGFRDPLGQLNVGSGMRFRSQGGTLARCQRSSGASALCSALEAISESKIDRACRHLM